jgi:peptidyl-prolyl cis-trans isomerase SurA
LLEQTLIRREMEISRYPLPIDEEIPALLEVFRKDNFRNAADYSKKLTEYGVTEKQLGRALLNQAAILRFVELRFRPGVAVGEGEVEIYYREQFVPGWEKDNPGKPPPDIEDAAERIEQVLAAERVDRALDEWLREARNQARVRYFEEAFR